MAGFHSLRSPFNKYRVSTIEEDVNTRSISVSDTITVTESVAVIIPGLPFEINVFDSITVTENIQTELNSFINVSDNITVTETVTMLLLSFINVSDSITVSEAINLALVHTFSVSDSITVTEAIQRVLECFVNKSESITITDTVYALQIDKRYQRAEVNALPTNNADLAIHFTQQEYADVATSDDTRVTQ